MAAGTRRGDGPQIDAATSESIRYVHDSVVHRIRLGRRIHELLDELDVALSNYAHHVTPENEDDVARFSAELRRVRGGTDACCPIPLELTDPAHVDRAAFITLAGHTGLSGNALEASLGRSRGYASKTRALKTDFPAYTKACERCGQNAQVTAAVMVVDEKTSRRILERQALCVDCYDVAIADG